MIKRFVRRMVTGLLAVPLALGAQLVAPALLPSSALASASAADLLPALVPTFSAGVSSAANGFSFNITNYDGNYTWTVVVPPGITSVIRPLSGGRTTYQVGILGVPLDSSATIVVTASRAGYADGTASYTGYSKKTGLTPVFGTQVPTYYGFSVPITNYSPNYSWFVAATNGTATLDNTGMITVSGLGDGTTSSVTATTTRTDYTSGSASIAGSALPFNPALVPSFETVSQELNTVTIQVTNFDSAFAWAIDYSSSGTASIDENGLITVTDLEPGTPVTIFISTTRYSYYPGQGRYDFVSTSQAHVPEIPEYIATADGFTVRILNYLADVDWSATTDAGTATIDSHALATVSGLNPGQSATLIVTTTQANREPGNAVITGRALYTALVPVVGVPTSTVDGFTMQIENFDPAYQWYFTDPTNAGYARVNDSGAIIVVGLSPGQRASYHLVSRQSGFIDGRLTISGSSSAPVVVPPVTQTVPSADSTDSADTDDATELAEIEAQSTAKIRKVAEDAIREKAEAKAALEAKAAAVVAEKLAKDLKAVAGLIGTTKTVPPAAIKSLTASQISLIPISTFRALSPISVKAISPIQAAALTPGQVKSLSASSLIKLSPAAIGSLKPEALGALSIAKLKALTKAQVKAIWFGQLHELDPDQRKAIRR